MAHSDYSPGEQFYLDLVEELKNLEDLPLDQRMEVLEEKRRAFPQFRTEIEHAAWEMYIDESRNFPASLDDFKVLRKLDEGGMGTLYLAEQRPFQRQVVIKTISPLKFRLESPDDFQQRIATARKLFAREQQILADLHLTNIIPIFAAGQCEGIEYFAMPYIEGESLAKVIKSSRVYSETASNSSYETVTDVVQRIRIGAGDNTQSETSQAEAKTGTLLDFRSAVQVLIDLLDSLHSAHQQGVIHRDIKPDNIMIRDNGQAFLIDFGVAKFVSDHPEVDAADIACESTTRTSRAGTWQYMAPEHLQGNASRASDLWSMGVVLYQVLTQELPFSSPSEIGTQSPIHPTERNGIVPIELGDICLKALAVDVPERFATAKSFSEDLQRWMRGDHVHARDYGKVELATKWVGRNRSLSAAMAFALVAIVAIAGGLIQWQLSKLNAAEQDAAISEQKRKTLEETSKKEMAESRSELARQELIAATTEVERNSEIFKSVFLTIEDPNAAQMIARSLVANRMPDCLNIIDLPDAAFVSQSFCPAKDLGCYSSIGNDVHIYDLKTARLEQTLQGHSNTVLSHAFNRDGSQLVSGGRDRTVRIWDVESGATVGRVQCPSEITAVAFSPDTRYVYAGSGSFGNESGGIVMRWATKPGNPQTNVNSPIWIIDVNDLRVVGMLQGHRGKVNQVQCSLDGSLAISASDDGTVRLWDLEKREQIHEFQEATAGSVSVHQQRTLRDKMSRSLLKSGMTLEQVGEVLNEMEMPSVSSPIQSVMLAPDNKIALAVSVAGHVLFCDLATGAHALEKTDVVNLGTGLQMSAAMSPNFSSFAVSTRDGYARLADPRSGEVLNTYTGPGSGERINRVSFVTHKLLSSGSDSVAMLWGTARNQRMRSLTGIFLDDRGTPDRQPVALSEDGSLVVAAGVDGCIRVWDTVTGVILRTMEEGSDRSTTAIGISSDNKYLVTGGEELVLWDLESGKKLRTLQGHLDQVVCIDVFEERMLASGSADGTARVWDLEKGECLHTLEHPQIKNVPTISIIEIEGRQVLLPPDPNEAQEKTARVSSVVFSPDGKRLLTDGNGVRIWDLSQPDVHVQLVDEFVAGNLWTFSKDGNKLVSWRNLDSAKNEFVLWDAATGKVSQTIPMIAPNGLPMVAASFSDDANYILGVSRDGTVKIFSLETDFPIYDAKLTKEPIVEAHFSPDCEQLVAYLQNGRFIFFDFAQEVTRRALFESAMDAAKVLRENPNSAADLSTLGKWYLLNEQWKWASELLGQAKKLGQDVDFELAFSQLQSGRPSEKGELGFLGQGQHYLKPALLKWNSIDPSNISLRARTPYDSVSLSASEDGEFIFVSHDTSPAIQLKITADAIEQIPLPNVKGSPLVFAGNGKRMAGRTDASKMGIFDFEANRMIGEPVLGSNQPGVIPMCMSREGDRLFVGTREGKVLAFAGEEDGGEGFQPVFRAPPPQGFATRAREISKKLDDWQNVLARAGSNLPESTNCLDLARDGRLMVVGYGIGGGSNYPGFLQIVDSSDGSVVAGRFSEWMIESVAISDDGSLVAASDVTGNISIFMLTGDKLSEPVTVAGHAGKVCSLAFSRDGKHLVSGGVDQVVRVSSTETGDVAESFRCHSAPITNAFFLNDGRIISGARDGELLVWNPTTLNE